MIIFLFLNEHFKKVIDTLLGENPKTSRVKNGTYQLTIVSLSFLRGDNVDNGPLNKYKKILKIKKSL
jgi:hypothetical protein